MLVNDKPKVSFGFLHLAQYVFEPASIYDVHGRLQYGFELEILWLQKVRNQILAVDETDHVIHRVTINR